MTIAVLWASMGFLAKAVVITLAVLSIYSIGVMVERFIAIRKARQQSVAYAERLAPLLESEEDDDAIAAAESLKQGYLPRVLAAGLKEYQILAAQPHRSQDEVLQLTEKALERNAQRVLADLKRGLGGLATIGSSAPFIGLFGTVVGIINAFEQMAAKGSGGLATVSAGISEALVTTAFGLIVAIPAVAAFNYFTGTLEAITVDIAEAGGEVIGHLARRESTSAREAA
ncbi:MAG: MotA/TolQ/ExbB proton channel family protein [Deltaproteobacteria bacterium]|nr:MotA/TolQ/ExbB proton channel family protein [Deltaproteobacteria bacterium]